MVSFTWDSKAKMILGTDVELITISLFSLSFVWHHKVGENEREQDGANIQVRETSFNSKPVNSKYCTNVINVCITLYIYIYLYNFH